MVCYNTYRLTVETSETHDDVFCIVSMHFQKFSTVDNGSNNFVHVVGFVGTVWDNFVQAVLQPVDRVGAFKYRRFLQVILRNVRQQFLNHLYSILFGLSGEMGHARFGSMHRSATQLFLCNIFSGNGFYHFGTGKEHVGSSLGHDVEVSKSRGIYGTSCTGTEDT